MEKKGIKCSAGFFFTSDVQVCSGPSLLERLGEAQKYLLFEV